jgi:hypothetical protein
MEYEMSYTPIKRVFSESSVAERAEKESPISENEKKTLLYGD